MVSGFVTSPCDQERIFSGDARLMRIASKSVVREPRVSKLGLMYQFTISTSNQLTRATRDLKVAGYIRSRLSQHGFTLVCCWCLRLHDLLLRLHQLHVQAQRLELADEHVERLRQARLERRVALDDRFVDLRAARDVVGLRREQLLEDVRRAVGLERPHLHFAEALTAELRLAAERLLRDERIRPDRARVDLVVDQVGKLKHLDYAKGI